MVTPSCISQLAEKNSVSIAHGLLVSGGARVYRVGRVNRRDLHPCSHRDVTHAGTGLSRGKAASGSPMLLQEALTCAL